MNYFLNCLTVFEIKKRFRELAMIHHPDMGGDNETMRIILEQYQEALQSSNGQTSFDEQGKEHTYYYNEEHEQQIADKIQELLSLRLPGDVEIALIGKWVWVTGNTKPHASKLNRKTGIGLTFHKKRLCWYWKPYSQSGRYNQKANLGDLAKKYGYKKFQNEEKSIGG